jgi:hypothetical protein
MKKISLMSELLSGQHIASILISVCVLIYGRQQETEKRHRR